MLHEPDDRDALIKKVCNGIPNTLRSFVWMTISFATEKYEKNIGLYNKLKINRNI